MVMIRTERDRIAAMIAELRIKQERLPIHFVDQRELLAQEIEALVLDWLASE